MTIEKLNGYLLAFANLNHGPNHGSDYAIDALPVAPSLQESLEQYFSAFSTSTMPMQPASAWNIRSVNLGVEWSIKLQGAVIRWLFNQEYSIPVDEMTQVCCANDLIDLIKLEIGATEVFEVCVDPPMWYECDWQDFAILAEQSVWLLHFGFSD